MDRNNACSLPLVALSLVAQSDTARNILSGARAAEAAAAGTR
jgi:hypothetical protein